MRVYRVRAFENVPSFNAVMASVCNLPQEEVEFLSIPMEVQVEPASMVETEHIVETEHLDGEAVHNDSKIKNACAVENDVEAVEDVLLDEEEETLVDIENAFAVKDDDEAMEEDVVDEQEERLVYDVDVVEMEFTGLDSLPNMEVELGLAELPAIEYCEGASESCINTAIVSAASEGSSSRGFASVGLGKGFRTAPDKELVKAGEGEERQKSHKNDRWASRRADQLRSSLGWDMSTSLGDLDFKELDLLFSDLFTRVVKVNGQDYPSESLMNMLGGFNRIMRRASEIRAVKGNPKANDPLPKDFNIKYHFAFPRTRLVLRAAVQKSAKEGHNKKRAKVGTVTLEMEMAIKLDHEHQITDSAGCQKRLALYLMLRLGIRGGIELWNLKRDDVKLLSDSSGREYIGFEERESKNNSYTLNRNKEEQFRKTYYTFEDDFILTFKQYYRHLPPLVEGMKADLFMQPIAQPAGLIWYNKVTKVAERVCGQWLKNMMLVVGLPAELITSNKAGRVTLITRMAACGVPDEVGCLVTGHHTTEGYGRYDRTKELKMEAAILAGCTPGLTFENALSQVSKKFVEEKIVGTSIGLCPLMDKATLEKEANLRREMRQQIEGSMGHLVVSESSKVAAEVKNQLKRPLEVTCIQQRQVVQMIEPPNVEVSPVLQQNLTESHQDYDMIDWEQELESNPSLARALTKVSDRRSKQLAAWHLDYDSINWDEEIRRNPKLARDLGTRNAPVQTFTGNTFSNLSNCTIQICVGPSRDNDDNKENNPAVNEPGNSKT